MHPTYNPGRYPTTQVIHEPNQVRSPKELVVGEKYFRRWVIDGRQGEGDSLLEVQAVMEGLGQHLFKAHVTSRSTPPRFAPYETIFLSADFGFVPFWTGDWDPFNYLVPAKEVQPTQS
jgi:hypothetical protein